MRTHAGCDRLPKRPVDTFTAGVTDSDEAAALALVARRLRTRFPSVSSETVDAVVADYHREYDGRPIRDYVPLLVERQAREHLSGIPQQRSPDDLET